MQIKKSELKRLISNVLLEAVSIGSYITDRESGNAFRGWVNKTHPDVAKKFDLDPEGSHNNSYIKKAWNELGDEYVASLEKGGGSAKEKLKGTAVKALDKGIDAASGKLSTRTLVRDDPTADKANVAKRGDGYVVLGSVTTSGVIRNGIQKALAKTDMSKSEKDAIVEKFDKLPQGHGFAISITSDGKCTGTEFGSYPKGDCARMGIEPGVLRDIELGPKNKMLYTKYAKKIKNDSKFRKQFLTYVLEKNPDWAKKKYNYDLKTTTRWGDIEVSEGVKVNVVDKAASKYMIGFVSSAGLEDVKGLKRQMKLEKRFLFKNSATLTGALYGAGTVMKYDLGTIKLGESGPTEAQVNQLCKKFEGNHRKSLGGGNSPAVYGVFRAKNVGGGNKWLANQDGCRTYVIFPSGLSKRLRTSDNCGTFAYRFFGKCMGVGAGLPIGLWNAPMTLVKIAKSNFRNRLILEGTYTR